MAKHWYFLGRDSVINLIYQRNIQFTSPLTPWQDKSFLLPIGWKHHNELRFCSPSINLYNGNICSICSICIMLYCSPSANISSALFALHPANYTAACNLTNILYPCTAKRRDYWEKIPSRTERFCKGCKIHAWGKSQGPGGCILHYLREELILTLSMIIANRKGFPDLLPREGLMMKESPDSNKACFVGAQIQYIPTQGSVQLFSQH